MVEQAVEQRDAAITLLQQNVAEVVGSTSYHAFCSSTPFVHAGPENLLVNMAPSTGACF